MATTQTAQLDQLLDLLAEKIAARLQAPDPAGEPKLLSIKEAAHRMGCSPSSVRNLISSGSLPQRALRRFGRRVLIDRQEFDKWLSVH